MTSDPPPVETVARGARGPLARVQLDRVSRGSHGDEPVRVLVATVAPRERAMLRAAFADVPLELVMPGDLADALAQLGVAMADVVIVGDGFEGVSRGAVIRALANATREGRGRVIVRVDDGDEAEQALLFGADEVSARALGTVDLVARVRAAAQSRHASLRLEREHAQLLKENIELRAHIAYDPLTGLANRRQFERRLAEETERGYRYAQPLVLMAIALDDGAASDAKIRYAAHVITRCARLVDIVARVDGVQFYVLAPSTTMPGARVFAERVRAALARESEQGDTGARLGVACLVPDLSAAIVDPVSLMSRADAALDLAQSSGERVVFAH